MSMRTRPALLAAAALVCLPGTQPAAEPVHVEHAGGVGAGYTFRRGNTCTVLTADHVVSFGELAVIDRSGAKAAGEVSYSNPVYDLALVTLPDDAGVACSTPWPETIDLADASLSGDTRFEAVRHYPDGREALILLTYAGGTPDELTLAPVDRTGIRESDSGSIVLLGGEPAGIVLRVRTRDDRVDVLRFDTIDELVGERFRGAGGDRALVFAGVRANGRANASWSAYVRSWLVEEAGWTLVDAGDERAACTVEVDVLSWERANRPNENYARAADGAAEICERGGLLAEQLCKAANRELEDLPRDFTTHTVMVEVGMTRRSGAMSSNLGTGHYEHDAAVSPRSPEIELAALNGAVAQVAGEMFDAGACL